MKNLKTFVLVVVGLAAGPGASQAEEALFTIQSLTPETALRATTAALEKCRAEGYQAAVAVVDRAGNLQALIRDRYAGPHTPETARRKAWTAASFRTNTSDLVEFVADNPVQGGIRHVSDALLLGGGLIIEAGGSLVGAIGVSGAPSADADDACAQAGIEAIAIDIQF